MRPNTLLWLSVSVFVLGVFFCGSTQLHGQGLSGQVITGTIADSTGAVVPEARVVVTNLSTGVAATLTTDNDGIFRTPPIEVGQYQVTVSKQGFETLVRTGITLHLAEVLRLDLALTVGQMTQSVEVKSAAPILNTEDARISQVVEQKAVATLPTTDHLAGSLVQVGPGVYYEGEDSGSFGAPRFDMAGASDIVLSLDGANDATPRTNVNQMVLNPPEESIQEVQVQSSYYGAQFGGAEGGMVRYSTKSGTNQFHGAVYEMNRNTIFDTRQFFASTKSPDHFNQFGGSIGGPIRRDKTFFFFNAELSRTSSPNSELFTVATKAMQQGDFSALSTPIYDPATTMPNPANPSQYIRTQFPGNVIPTNGLDPVAQKIISYLPSPNGNGVVNNLAASWANQLNRNAFVTRIDEQLSSKDTLSGVWTRSHYTFGSANFSPAFQNPAADYGQFSYLGRLPSDSYVFTETHTFSPSLVASVRYAWRPDTAYTLQHGNEFAPWGSTLGIKNYYADRIFPAVNFAQGYIGLGNNSVLSTGENPPKSNYAENSMEWYLNVTKIRGKNTINFGLGVQRSRNEGVCGLTDTGDYNFDQRLTALPGVAGTGDSIASFMVGAISTASIFDCTHKLFQEWYVAPYVEDSIRATSKLTLDFGLRWDVDLPVQEIIAHQGSGFDPFAINPVSGTPGVITFQGEPGVPYGFYKTDWGRFGPRVGFAYQLPGKIVLRAGYGIYGISPALGSNRGAPTLGYDLVNASFSTLDNGLTPAFYLQNGIPAYPVGQSRTPAFGAVPLGQKPTTSPSYVPYNWSFGYSQNFNLSVQKELPGEMLVELDGLGLLGRKLPEDSNNINSLVPGLWGVEGNTQSLLPYPQFGPVHAVKYPTGTTNYYAMNVSLTKRLSHGLILIGNYTWQKELGITNPESIYMPGLSYGPTTFNEANAPSSLPYHLLRITSVYDLPAGPGKRYVNTGPAKWVLGGWTVGGIYTYDSGLPYSLRSSVDSENCGCALGDRLNQIGSLAGPKTTSEWFNTSGVALPTFGTIGTLGPGTLIGPNFNNIDLSVAKTTNFTERYGLKLELEMFNATNTTKFGLPGTSFGTGSFGVISGVRGLGSGTSFTPPYWAARIMQLSARFAW